MHKRKAGTVQSDTVGYYHRSKLCCLGICERDRVNDFVYIQRFFSRGPRRPRYNGVAVYLKSMLVDVSSFSNKKNRQKTLGGLRLQYATAEIQRHIYQLERCASNMT